jgi:hypothetical protein
MRHEQTPAATFVATDPESVNADYDNGITLRGY